MTPSRSRWRRLLRSAIAYAAVTVFATAGFVLLHHIGNKTPLAVVAQKIAAEFEAEPVAWGTRWADAYQPWEHCYINGAVLAGSMPSTTPAFDAFHPRTFSNSDHCLELRRFASDPSRELQRVAQLQERDDQTGFRKLRLRPQQWFGSKALYAIGLRFLTIRGYHELIRYATYAAYAFLAVALLLLLGWRAWVAASPLLLFGVAFSGIEHASNVAKGTPYIWALVAPALVALLLRWARVPAFATRLFCFFAGMVACYLWLFGGANFIAAVLIGLVAWLHGEPSAVKARAARAVGCVLALAAGFVVGLALTLPVKVFPLGAEASDAVWDVQLMILSNAIRDDLLRILAPVPHDLLGKEIGLWMEGLPLGVGGADVLIAASVIALGAALLTAGLRAWRRDWLPLQELLCLGVLGIAPLIHLLLPNDTPYAAARLMYLPLALCWTAFAVVLLRTPRPVAHLLVFVVVGSALLGLRFAWQHAAATALLAKIHEVRSDTGAKPLMEGHFNIFHLDDGPRLIYRRDRCDNADMKRRFVLDVFPQRLADLSDADRAAGRERTMFYFANHRLFTFGGGCTAVVDLPAFPIAKITTGRYCCYEGEPTWRASAILDRQPLRDAARAARTVPPLARDHFDVHRVGDDLVYLREPCTKEDVRCRFFLHVFPKRDAGAAGSSDFANLDFDFFEQGVHDNGQCVAVRALPRYDIDRARTGQFGDCEAWTVEFPITPEP